MVRLKWCTPLSDLGYFFVGCLPYRYCLYVLLFKFFLESCADIVPVCKEYYQFMLAHAAFGLSGSILYSPATAVAGHWFMHRRSTAVGIVVCGSGLAGVIYPIALDRLTKQLSSLEDSI